MKKSVFAMFITMGAAVVKWLAHATRDRLIPIVGGSNLLGAGISERRFGILA